MNYELLLFLLLNVLYYVFLWIVYKIKDHRDMQIIKGILPFTLKKQRKRIEGILKQHYIEIDW